MKEFDVDEALDTMIAALPAHLRSKVNEEDVATVMDLIFDYFDREDDDIAEAGDTIDFDSMDQAVEAVSRYVRHHIPSSGDFSVPEEYYPAMVRAELEYEDSLD